LEYPFPSYFLFPVPPPFSRQIPVFHPLSE
jgi:hypothetical protein